MSKVALIGLISIARNLATRNPCRNVKLIGPNLESLTFVFDSENIENKILIFYKPDDKSSDVIKGFYCFDDEAVADSLFDGYFMPDQAEIVWESKDPVDYTEIGWSLNDEWVEWLSNEKRFITDTLSLITD